MFFTRYKNRISELEADLKAANEIIEAFRGENNKLSKKVKTLDDVSFKYKVTKALLQDDESILELLEDTLLAAAKRDIANNVDIRSPTSFFYRLVNEQANKVVVMFKEGKINE